jgi:transposase
MYGKYQSGMSMKAVADEFRCSKSTVQSIIEHRQRTGTVRPTYNEGNKHTLNPQAEQRMIRHVRASPKQTADQIADYMKVSASTVRRILKKNGYFRARCRCKPILSAKNVKDRLAWADANENQDWTRVIFTDESAFELGDDHAHESCWRLPHEEYSEKCLSPKKKRGKHVWGAIISGHKFPLVRFALRPEHQEGGKKIAAQKINAKVYVAQTLEGPLTDAVAWAKGDGRDVLVVEDGAPVHKITNLVAERAKAGVLDPLGSNDA